MAQIQEKGGFYCEKTVETLVGGSDEPRAATVMLRVGRRGAARAGRGRYVRLHG